MTTVTAEEGYRLWSAGYDRDPNPVTALEQRLLGERMPVIEGSRVLDLGTGTGRWLEHAVARGARGIGFDLSAEMLGVAAQKRGIRGRLAAADLCALPLGEHFADVAICSFVLGYVGSLERAFREMARVARRVIVSDLHPDALDAGWSRSFRAGEQTYDIAHHNYSAADLNAAARAAGLAAEWTMEARFGEPERVIFERAGKSSVFAEARRVNAVLISAWVRA